MNWENIIEEGKYVLAVFGGLAVSLVGGWDKLLYTLIVMASVDYTTGVIAAFYQKKLSSEIGSKGIIKKFLMFVIVAVAVQLDTLLNSDFLRSMAIMFYVGTEGISILENVANCDLPIPQPIKDALVKVKKEGEGNVSQNSN